MVKIKLHENENGTRSWEELEKGSPEGLYYDGILLENLRGIKNVIRNDWDYIFVVDGEVGSGKSVLTQQIAYYLSDGHLSLNDICFSGEEFKAAVKRQDKYRAIIFDEAFRGLSARAALTAINRSIIQMLNEIRQKNLFVFIVIPSIWDLDTYVRLHRCKGLINVYTANQRERGFFKFYRNGEFFKNWFSKAQNRYKYPHPPDFKGVFTGFIPVGDREYRKKKSQALLESDEVASKEISGPTEKMRNRLIQINRNLLFYFPKLPMNKRSSILGVNRDTLKTWESQEIDPEKAGMGISNLPERGSNGEI